MIKMLVVDDEEDIRNLISRFAEHEGHIVTCAENGNEALEQCKANDFDIVIMDVMMDGMDGLTACKEIKKIKDVPILMLSARGAEYDKLMGFELGVDDYVVKPFSPRELMARVQAIMNRYNVASKKGQILSLGLLEINKTSKTVTVNKSKILLTAKEYEILLYLAEHETAALSRQQIIDGVWGQNYYCDERTVDWQIKLLRGKLESCRDYITTVRGTGYKFEVIS